MSYFHGLLFLITSLNESVLIQKWWVTICRQCNTHSHSNRRWAIRPPPCHWTASRRFPSLRPLPQYRMEWWGACSGSSWQSDIISWGIAWQEINLFISRALSPSTWNKEVISCHAISTYHCSLTFFSQQYSQINCRGSKGARKMFAPSSSCNEARAIQSEGARKMRIVFAYPCWCLYAGSWPITNDDAAWIKDTCKSMIPRELISGNVQQENDDEAEVLEVLEQRGPAISELMKCS